ncbi:MAG TPA: hypothetical protein VII95_18830 [Terriglobales bacterium]|jgi:hypothetical protein
MNRMFAALVILVVTVCPPSTHGQAMPRENKSSATGEIVISLKVMQKALANCHERYSVKRHGESEPLAKLVIGSEGYEGDLNGLEVAEKLISGMIADPSKISGRGLVAALSTSDDFARGAASTQGAILLRAITESGKPPATDDLLIFATSLQGCSKELFDAGDEFVGVVLGYIAAEDAVVAERTHSPKP